MAPQPDEDIFSINISNNTDSPRVDTSPDPERTPASRLLLKLYCESSPTSRRSPKKRNRVLVDKGVGTIKMRREQPEGVLNQSDTDDLALEHGGRATTHETPTKRSSKLADATLLTVPLSSPTSSQNKNLRSSMSSSQSTYYEGDEEFEEIVAQMDDQEVEEMLPATSPVSIKNSSGSSGSSLRSTVSTNPTSVESSSFESNERRRKRTDAVDYPRRRAKPLSELRDACLKPKDPESCGNKKPDFRSCNGPLVVSAAHQRSSKQDRPIPRPIRDPGRSSAVTDTSTVAVNASTIVRPSAFLETKKTPPSPIEKSAVPDVGNMSEVNGSPQKQASREVEAASRPVSTSSSTPSNVQQLSVSPFKRIRSGPGCHVPETNSDEQKNEIFPIIIAHDEKKQRLLDDNGIAKGVQYEIARGITHGWWTWDDVTVGVVEQLRGSNFEKAGRVAELIGKGPKERLSKAVISTRQAIYAELDREQDAFLENKSRSLGLMGPWKGKDNWHGGCIQLRCKLEFIKDAGRDKPSYVIRLNPFGIGKSNRAARKFTSLSILQLKFEDGALYDEKKLQLVMDRLSRHVIICGRTYCAFCSKENKIFFVETKEDFQRRPVRSMGDHYRMSHRRFVKITNPPDLNGQQAMNKWLARWQLLLSTSRPVIEFDPENIYLGVDDIFGENGDKDSIMTDGCGWMNLSALRQIATATNAPLPVVVHGRIGGSKGLWVLHPAQEHRTETEPPKIWIRHSQLKIKLPPTKTWDRSLRIFDLLRLPRLTTPSGLNLQTILNMSYNGVKDGVFSTLMEAGLQREIEPLTNWSGQNACTLVAKAVEHAGGIMASRRSRGAGSDARLYSYVRDEKDDDDESAANGGLVERDPISGCPQSLCESARDMLVAGFSPLENAVLREKLRYILKQTIDSYLEKFHIPIIFSAEAFIAPDPYGVLKEGEIFFRSSVPIGDPMTCIDPHMFRGPVLVTRNPTRVPSDVQKVMAVSCDQLLSYTDVIIFSIKGKRSLASYLGGGDYDGDTVTVIAEPSLVEAFTNSDHVPEPPTVREAFEEEVERVSGFLEKLQNANRQRLSFEFAKKVLRGLSDGKVGLYSHFHDNAIYELGYDAPDTIRLAYMFTTCLDAVKSGLRIKPAVFKEDSLKWNVPRPECMQTAEESARNANRDTIGRRLVRPRRLGPFVLETLKNCAKELQTKALCEFEKLNETSESSTHWSKHDDDLARPYFDMKSTATALREKSGDTCLLDDLEKIERFVESLCEQYIAEVGAIYGDKGRKNGGNESSSKSVSQLAYEFSRRFEEGPSDCLLPLDIVKELKASYAHVYGTSKSKIGRGFGFAVAEDTLCAIKIRRKGGASICRECRDYTLISPNLVKLISAE